LAKIHIREDDSLTKAMMAAGMEVAPEMDWLGEKP
jgi:hypothetical protein